MKDLADTGPAMTLLLDKEMKREAVRLWPSLHEWRSVPAAGLCADTT